MYDAEDNLFLLAGPVKLHPRVQRAMSKPAQAHRSPEFTQVNKRMYELLKKVYQTRYPVVCLTGSGTAAMDATIGSLVTKEDKVVALDNGKFGNRMAEISQRYAGTVEVVEADWGQPVDLDEVATKLRGAKALVVTHNETSAGFTHPLQELQGLAQDAGALTIVDCITSLGGMDIPVDEWGLDAVIAGSQKCMGAPAGVSYVSLSADARDELVQHPSYYLDLTKYLKKLEGHQTPFTPATHLHLATVEALELMLEEGLEERFERVRQTAEATRAAAEALGLELFAHPDHRSDTVTAMRLPEGLTDEEFRGELKERGILVAGGQAHVKGKIFRVGHMGQVDVKDVVALFANLEHLLSDLGQKVEIGASTQAIADAIR